MAVHAIDEARLEAFIDQVISDMAAAASAPMALIGERLGLYREMAGAGPLSTHQLAQRAEVDERYVREWLGNQAAGGYVVYDPRTDRYELPDEHALALADETSPFYSLGAFDVIAAMWRDEERIDDLFRTGGGIGWHDHDPHLYDGMDRFFRPGYRQHLVAEWIPALGARVETRLTEGARVVDVGCGFGATTIFMAQAFPRSEFVGIDTHGPSIERARTQARRAGVAEQARFEVASAKHYAGAGFDLACAFDSLHDMGDPIGTARHVRQTLGRDGVWMIVEPQAGDHVEDNLTPVGRMFYAASTQVCMPCSRAQEVGLALGAQAGEAKLSQVLEQAGFSRVRRAAETPFNMVLEARV